MATTSSTINKEVSKINIKYQFMNQVFTNLPFMIIKEIQNKRILVLGCESFEIFDIRTKKRICRIEGEFEKEDEKRYNDNIFFDFIELKNKDLILWSKGKIFYYKKFDNKY